MAIDPREFNDPKAFDDMGDFQEINEDFLEKSRVSWFTRTLLRIALPWGFSRLANELNGPGIELSRKAHAFFAKAERIDIIPLRIDLRGFRLIVDGALAIYFVQDGDHFAYDGFELGPQCEGGDVTIFDGAG